MKPASKTGRPVLPPQQAVPAASPVILETQGYQIRSLRPHDASEKLSSWLADPDMMWGLNIPARDWPIEKQQAFILSFDNRKRYLIGIFAKVGGTLIGFYILEVNLTHRTAHISVGIGDRDYWGKNVLAETTPALLDCLFKTRGIEKVVARIIPTNRRILFGFMNSKRFFFEGRLIGELLTPNGERTDVLSFAALKDRPAAAR
jgi:RimJ/RimL family protein N-acetyltransferase